MFVYVSKVFTATATGSRFKEVTCEKCAKHFFYELSRMGVGASSAPYMLGQGAAKTNSEKRAAVDLQKRLMKDQEAIPCPACQWINLAAIRAYQKTKQRGWTTLSLVVMVIGIVINLVVFGMSQDVLRRDPALTDPVHWEIAVSWILLVGLCFLSQFLLRRRIDLNRSYDGKKRLPVGTPPAIVPIGENADGELQYEVVPYDLTRFSASTKWAVCRAGQFELLPLCCRCLGEPSVTLKLPFVAQAQPIPVPMCQKCRTTIIRNLWLANLLSLVSAIAIVWMLAQLPRGIDETGRTIMTVLGGGMLAVIGFFAVDELIRPYKVVIVDGPRGITKIRFRNPAYTALLIRRIGEADGYFKMDDVTT